MPSTEPSSTTTSSRSRSVCPSTLATASPIVARASRAARTTETRGGLIASRRVACAGARSRAPERRPRRRDRRSDGRARRAPRLARGTDAPADAACSSSTRTTTIGSPGCSPRHPSLRDRAPALDARAVARAERRARPARGRPRRVPRRRLPLPAGAPRAASRGASRRTRRSVVVCGRARGRGRSGNRSLGAPSAVAWIARQRLARRRPRPRSSCAARSSSRSAAFDEALGLGPDARFGSGEEIDYLVRALRSGARVEYDPALVVIHPVRPTTGDALVALGRRDGGSVGYVLGRHGYPARAVARMLVRPAVGALVSLVLLDTTRARFHAATLRRAHRRPALRPLAPLTTRAPRTAPRAGRASRPSAKRSTARRRAPSRVALAIGQDTADTPRRAPPAAAARRARTRPGCGTPTAALVADELDRAAARRVHDGQAARHRLDHRRRARVVHLGVEEDVRAAEDVGRLRLRVSADEVDRVARARVARSVGAGSETSRPAHRAGGHRDARRARAGRSRARARAGTPASGRRRAARPGRPAGRGPGVNRSTSTAFGRISHVPRAGAEEVVGRPLAERALVDDVVGRRHGAAERHVELVRPLARPAGVRDAVHG